MNIYFSRGISLDKDIDKFINDYIEKGQIIDEDRISDFVYLVYEESGILFKKYTYKPNLMYEFINMHEDVCMNHQDAYIIDTYRNKYFNKKIKNCKKIQLIRSRQPYLLKFGGKNYLTIAFLNYSLDREVIRRRNL